MSDQGVIVRALLCSGAVRLLLAEARGPAEHTRTIHGLGPDAARLGAEALVAAALNAAHVKGEEQLTLQLQGEVPRCSVYADITAQGHVRARITPADLRLGPSGELSGVLVVIKSLGARQLYQGVTDVRGATIERALGEHLDRSAQVDDILRIGVRQAADGTIVGAGGLLLERLPEDPGHPSLDRETFQRTLGWVRDADVDELLTGLALGSLGDEPLRVLEQRPLVWQCRCSDERVRATLAILGPDEVQQMLDEDGGAEISCNFCGTVRRLDAADLRAVLREQRRPEGE